MFCMHRKESRDWETRASKFAELAVATMSSDFQRNSPATTPRPFHNENDPGNSP